MRTTATRAAAALALLLLVACKGRDEAAPNASSPAAAAAPAAPSGLRPPENPDPTANTYAPALGVDLKRFRKTPSGLYIRDDKVGTGAEAKAGTPVRVHYAGYLTDGKKFDASRDRGEPYAFTPSEGRVIKAWDEGIPGMRAGGVRTLVVPPEIGYGALGAEPDIPANAVLVFRVDLLDVGK